MAPVRCPRCIKRFKDQATLLKHMNQPISSCLTHFQELLDIANTLQTKATTPAQLTDHQLGEEPLSFMDTTDDPFSAPLADSVHASFSPSEAPRRNTKTVQNPLRIEKHPTAGQVFGRGETFMDKFDNDDHASARSNGFLYYPFASRHEWELASFLLRSSMSLADIDCFLRLQLVSFTLSYTVHVDNNFGFNGNR
jgi:hypothetical protein